jgi:ketosteroid isomerase-like protein
VSVRSTEHAQTIRSLFAAFTAKDRRSGEALLADGFTFTSPYDDAIDRAAYFERCWPNSDRIRTQVLEKIFVEGDEAFVRYRCTTADGNDFRNTEFFTFDGDKIGSVSVYFGATYSNGVLVKDDAPTKGPTTSDA